MNRVSARANRLEMASIVVAASASAVRPIVGLFVIGIAGCIAIWRRPRLALESGVILILTVRPWVDAFSERRAGIGPFIPNPAVLVGLAVLAIAIVIGIRRGRSGQRLWPERSLRLPHLFLLAAYMAAMLAGWYFYGRQGLAEGIREAVRVASIIAAFLLVRWWADLEPRFYRRGWTYLICGAVVPIGVAISQFIYGTGFLESAGLNRLQGTFSHPNSFGQYLIPFVLFFIGLALAASGLRRLCLLAVAAALTWLIVHTYSRTVVVVLLLGVVVLPILHASRLTMRSAVRVLAMCVMLAAIAWFVGGPLIRERFANLQLGRSALDAATAGASENSYEWRLINWSVLIGLGLEHPIVGHGAGMTSVLNPIVNPENGVPFNAHNDYVRFFFEGGLLGLLGYLIYVWLMSRWIVRSVRSSSSITAPGVFGIAAAWLALLLLSVGNTELSLHTADLYALYGMLALMAATTTDFKVTSRPVEAHMLSNDQRLS